MSACYNAALVFCIVIFCVVFIIIYFVPSLSSIFLHAVFMQYVRLVYSYTFLQLLLLCPVKPANIRHFK